MAACSNPRCNKPKPGNNDRCLSCRALLADTLVRHRYRIAKTMGRGGFGTTYLSLDQDRFDEPCLLKELHPDSEEDDDGMAERLFKREAQVLLNLRHRGIPKLHAYFAEKDYSYLVQDYIPGSTLAEEVDQRKRTYNEQEARDLLYELAEILEYLHTHSPPIIHRDVKPQNLMRHASGRLLLIDFGAVCQAASSQTLIGSPGYVPPEQILGRPVPQSDLYAAGATALRLLSGLHPSQLFNHRTKELEWQSHIKTSSGFADILNALVAQKVSDRLSSASELKRCLEGLKTERIEDRTSS
jgi:serine/threonine protein kinase, bacterial